ncbi:MAG: DUF882 domain-containing protein [Chloroflexi bacterium AL-W]|nr:DUF882 domain-containing protein [Chloroflexi bacterium AL-N1]NOK66502.1 DUF882 domain-containing protein [Chloroflexi bacterium AL-N10]NOK71890.1 DUF882 domain-containing protein [Chloroflexi bacterium AL-N5]NOK81147.1 DUF882 domain-containing protein [Chloroflexi bacterium AL-W]NOK89420.1 DUF882 domain-containing protein [Chloroflexi bacterium AL-N15]
MARFINGAGARLLRLVVALVLLASVVASTAQPTYAYNWPPVLYRGMQGSAVKELQIRIAGWAADSPSRTFLELDGDFGSQTEAAVRRFQRAYGLQVDGRVGPQTQAQLNRMEESDRSTINFDWSEFYSKDGSGFRGGKVSEATVRENIRRLMWKLEALRKKAGNNSVNINSGFRSIAHNSRVGGSSNSQHMYGLAADIRVTGQSPSQVQSYAKTCGFSGIIRYSTFVHVDSRIEYPYGSQQWWWP